MRSVLTLGWKTSPDVGNGKKQKYRLSRKQSKMKIYAVDLAGVSQSQS
jgi:hypothetical protein